MTQYAQHFSTRATPQTEKAKPEQVANSAGGFVFQLDPWKQLDRWLILGGEGGSYYASERKLTVDNAKTISACLDLDGKRTVDAIVAVSDGGRAPKNDPAIFALAIAAGHKDPEVRRYALASMPKVCRIGTHLFQFTQAARAFRGWGPGLRKAVSAWYGARSDEELCFQLAKYAQRDGMSNRDLFRLAHPKIKNPAIARWVIGAELGDRKVAGSAKARRSERSYSGAGELPEFLAAFDELKGADEKRTIELIRQHGFTHEMVATERKNSPEVWEALLEKMPMHALVRNLAKMTAVGLVKPLAAASARAAEKLTDAKAIKKSRLHPVAILSALRVYAQGHGEKGSLKWDPVPQIVEALNSAFYMGFDAIEPTGKAHLLALDVSGSMASGNIAGIPGLTPRDVSAALAMATARVEKNYLVFGFSNRFVQLNVTASQRLDDVIRAISGLPFEATDCSLPMVYANANDLGVDAFHVYTDNETFAGKTHPFQALRKYREKSGRNARLAVLGMIANPFTIADPSDPGMLDVCGCDTSVPALLADFARS